MSSVTSEYIKLNIGGMLFQTTISTLTKFKDTMLANMFSGRMDMAIDKEGWILIDRSGKHFEVILNFLRDGTVPMPSETKELVELRAEANYYCISELVELCDQELAPPMNIQEIGPSTTIVLAEPLEDHIIKSFKNPIIILELSQLHVNYPPLHLTLFEKLALDFHEEIRFIRYVYPRSFNKWNFYTDGILIKEMNLSNEHMPEGEIYNGLGKLLQSLIRKPMY